MVHRILTWAAVLLFASAASAGPIVRGDKAVGGKAFTTGVILPDEVNYDFDTIYLLVNGNIDNDNIDANASIAITKLNLTGAITNTHIAAAGSANIAVGKLAQTAGLLDADIVGDFSDDEDEMDDTTNPGTSTSNTPATNLEIEIAQLRYVIQRLAIGTNATAVTLGATGTDTAAMWIDGPGRPVWNHVDNGGFDFMYTLADNTNGDGWNADDVGTLAAENLDESHGQGMGQGLNIITDDAVEGVNQVLKGLKADTAYLARVSVRDDVGQCRMVTLGASTAELTVDSDDAGDWQVLSGIFQTDGTPSDITLSLVGVATAADCIFDHVGVFEINADPIPPFYSGGITDRDNSTHQFSGSYAAIGGTEAQTVTPTTNGFMTLVLANFAVFEGSSTSDIFTARITENCGGGGATEVASMEVDMLATGNGAQISLHYFNPFPVADVSCVYTLEGKEESGAAIDVRLQQTVDGEVMFSTILFRK